MSRDPLRRSKRLQRKRFYRRSGFLVAEIIIVVILIILFFSIPYFRIETITLKDIKTIPEEKAFLLIDDFLHTKKWSVLPYSNFFIFQFVESNLITLLQNEFPRIDAIQAKKRLPRYITLYIEERDIWSTVCSTSSCFYTDRKGFLFGRSPRISGTVFFAIEDKRNITPVIGEAFLPEEELRYIQSLFEKIEHITGHEFRTLTITGDQLHKYEAETNKGWRIIFDARTDIEFAVVNFLTAYEGLLKEDLDSIDYIDLRLENKIFYKYK